MRGLLSFVLGGLLFAAGIIGLVASALSSSIADLWHRLGTTSLSLWPAVLLSVVFFIIFLAGVYLMKTALSRQG